MHGWMHGWMGRGTDGRMRMRTAPSSMGHVHGWSGCMSGWTDGWTRMHAWNRCMGGRTDAHAYMHVHAMDAMGRMDAHVHAGVDGWYLWVHAWMCM
jgi:hypothetical protein